MGEDYLDKGEHVFGTFGEAVAYIISSGDVEMIEV